VALVSEGGAVGPFDEHDDRADRGVRAEQIGALVTERRDLPAVLPHRLDRVLRVRQVVVVVRKVEQVERVVGHGR
jgi:hypothetical protein